MASVVSEKLIIYLLGCDLNPSLGIEKTAEWQSRVVMTNEVGICFAFLIESLVELWVVAVPIFNMNCGAQVTKRAHNSDSMYVPYSRIPPLNSGSN